MGEEEGVVSPLGAEGFDRLLGGLPRQAELGGVPLAKVEAVGPGLPDEQMKQFKAGHTMADFCAKNDFPALKSESKGTIEMYLKCSFRLRICHGECIILVHSPGCTAALGIVSLAALKCGGSRLGRPT